MEKSNDLQDRAYASKGREEFSEITLRAMDLSDVDDLMMWAGEEQVKRFTNLKPFTCKEEGMEFIKDKVIPHPWFRAICIKNRAVGAIFVKESSGNDRCRGEVSYVLASKYWGKGIATRAVKIVAATIFSDWPHLERLEALVDAENLASQRVLEKAGFQREAVLRKYYFFKGKSRDFVMFSLLSTDP